MLDLALIGRSELRCRMAGSAKTRRPTLLQAWRISKTVLVEAIASGQEEAWDALMGEGNGCVALGCARGCGR